MTLPDKLLVSLLLRGDGRALLPKAITSFQQWIASRALDDILIDVADYSHVPGGPGVVLIGYDYNCSVAEHGDQIELACFCKRNTPGQNPLLKTLRRLFEACSLLERPLHECGAELRVAAVEVSVLDRKVTDEHRFRTDEFAWVVAEQLASVLRARPQVVVASDTPRPTVRATWASPTAVSHLLEQLQANAAEAVIA